MDPLDAHGGAEGVGVRDGATALSDEAAVSVAAASVAVAAVAASAPPQASRPPSGGAAAAAGPRPSRPPSMPEAAGTPSPAVHDSSASERQHAPPEGYPLAGGASVPSGYPASGPAMPEGYPAGGSAPVPPSGYPLHGAGGSGPVPPAGYPAQNPPSQPAGYQPTGYPPAAGNLPPGYPVAGGAGVYTQPPSSFASQQTVYPPLPTMPQQQQQQQQQYRPQQYSNQGPAVMQAQQQPMYVQAPVMMQAMYHPGFAMPVEGQTEQVAQADGSIVTYQWKRYPHGCGQCDGLTDMGVLWIIILALLFGPVAFIVCLMPECYKLYKAPVSTQPPPGRPGQPQVVQPSVVQSQFQQVQPQFQQMQPQFQQMQPQVQQKY